MTGRAAAGKRRLIKMLPLSMSVGVCKSAHWCRTSRTNGVAMPKDGKSKLTIAEQRERFIETARELGGG